MQLFMLDIGNEINISCTVGSDELYAHVLGVVAILHYMARVFSLNVMVPIHYLLLSLCISVSFLPGTHHSVAGIR